MKRVILTTVAATLIAMPFPVSAEPSSTPEKIGTWTIKALMNVMTDETRGTAVSPASGEIAVILKCDQNGPDSVYVTFVSRHYLGSGSRDAFREVSYRLDDGTPLRVTAFYDGSTASVVSRKPDQGRNALLAGLARSRKLTVQVNAYDSNEYMGVIDVVGAREAITKVASTCKDQPLMDLVGANPQ